MAEAPKESVFDLTQSAWLSGIDSIGMHELSISAINNGPVTIDNEVISAFIAKPSPWYGQTELPETQMFTTTSTDQRTSLDT